MQINRTDSEPNSCDVAWVHLQRQTAITQNFTYDGWGWNWSTGFIT